MEIKNRNLFRLTRFILLYFPGVFKLLTRFRKSRKRVLIIKTDAIGDYILFRNYLEIVKNSKKFDGYEIDLLGNTLWQEIALQYDSQFIGNSFFIDPDSLYEAPLQTFKLGWKLFIRNYKVVLQPTFARTFITDGLAGLSAAKQIVGFEGDTERVNLKYKTKTDKYYTQRLQPPPEIFFEFDRYRFFFENVLSTTIAINNPFIEARNGNKSGIIIFPGAGVAKRGWEAEKFRDLILLILKHSQQPVYLAGSVSELAAGKYLAENLPPNALNNLIGKTTLPQLIELIGNASLLIANETSAIHIAVATQTKSVCILGGGHFGRFVPYPKYIKNKPICVFEKMECFHCNWVCKFPSIDNGPYPCIARISLEDVWNTVMPLL